MKVTIEHIPETSEDEVIIRCHKMDESVQKLIKFLDSPAHKILGDQGDEMHILDPDNVFYVESVDSKVFIYCKEHVYESKKKL